ncbi:DUF1969-domain-containing protein [Ramicandelaber brevisporus]|nr:DUF1969-domain-containing protein [Ramicandelaber brevisporus]
MTKLAAFIAYPKDSQFPLENLPFGVFSTASNPSPRVGVAIADQIVDMHIFSRLPRRGTIRIGFGDDEVMCIRMPVVT